MTAILVYCALGAYVLALVAFYAYVFTLKSQIRKEGYFWKKYGDPRQYYTELTWQLTKQNRPRAQI